MGRARFYAAFYAAELTATAALFYWLFVGSQASAGEVVRNGAEVEGFFALGLLAYMLGLGHALDADHLAAIDNSTRKLVREGKGSGFVGLYFSLGHSTVVIALSFLLMVSARYVASLIPSLGSVGNVLGTAISSAFLYVIGTVNLLILAELASQGGAAFPGPSSEGAKKSWLQRAVTKAFALVSSEKQVYVIGFLFGLGFDTASQTALLAISAASSGVFLRLPVYSLLVFPLLFTAGMTLVDTTDGFFVSGAYGWASSSGPSKLRYNFVMTLASVLVAYVVGTVEALGLIGTQLDLGGTFWSFVESLTQEGSWRDVGIIIVMIFVLTWLFSLISYQLKQSAKRRRGFLCLLSLPLDLDPLLSPSIGSLPLDIHLS